MRSFAVRPVSILMSNISRLF